MADTNRSHSFGHEGTKLQIRCGQSPWRRPYVSKWSSHFLLACKFVMTGLNLEERIHAKLVIVQRSSLLYLTEAAVKTRFNASFGMKFLIRRISQAGGEFLWSLLRRLVLSNWDSSNGLTDPLGLEKLKL